MDGLTKLFFDISVDCPYGLPFTATYRQSMFGVLPDELIEFFWQKGYRRNGNTIYTMNCQECCACIPIRLNPEEFVPNRNQKRVYKKNQDLSYTIGPIEITEAKLRLCNKFLEARYPGRGSTAEEYYAGFFLNAITNSFEIDYWADDRLVGVAIVDISNNCLNAVYFYFDPTEGHRSPGTYNILNLIEFCKEKSITFLYLGYWIEGVEAMEYKANFKPHYLLLNGQWVPVPDKNSAQNIKTQHNVHYRKNALSC